MSTALRGTYLHFTVDITMVISTLPSFKQSLSVPQMLIRRGALPYPREGQMVWRPQGEHILVVPKTAVMADRRCIVRTTYLFRV